jgi:periplasmic protein TonB
VEAVRRPEDSWGRLAWQVPLATLLTLVSLMSFLRLLEPSDLPPPAQRPLDVEVAELPPRIVAPPPTAPKPTARPTPPSVRERHPVETRPPVEPLPTVAQAAPPPTVASEPVDSTRPATKERDAIVTPPAGDAQPVAPSTAIAGTSVQEGNRASRAPHEKARDPAPGPRGEAFGGGNTGARAISQPLPEIPEALLRRSIEIIAVARFKVAANGSAQVELTGPTADTDLNRALLESLRRWRFFPAMQDGKPVASTVEIRIPISVR